LAKQSNLGLQLAKQSNLGLQLAKQSNLGLQLAKQSNLGLQLAKQSNLGVLEERGGSLHLDLILGEKVLVMAPRVLLDGTRDGLGDPRDTVYCRGGTVFGCGGSTELREPTEHKGTGVEGNQ
jgi:hypothetical protein